MPYDTNRPFGGSASTGGTSDHGSLLGLQDHDHFMYANFITAESYNVPIDGVTSVNSSVQTILTVIGSSVRYLYFGPGSYLFATSLSFPANVTVIVMPGCIFLDGGNAGVTLTFSGGLEAPNVQIFNFSGSGSGVAFADAAARKIKGLLSWWGSPGSSASMQAAINSGLYWLFVDVDVTAASTITFPSGICIEGVLQEFDSVLRGPRITFSGTGACLSTALSGTQYGVIIRNLRLNGTTNTNDGIIGLQLKDIRNSTFEEIFITGFGAACTGAYGLILDSDLSWSTVNTIRKVRVSACNTAAEIRNSSGGTNLCNANRFIECSFNGNGYGVNVNSGIHNIFESCLFQGSTAVDAYGIRFNSHDNKLLNCYLENMENTAPGDDRSGVLIEGNGYDCVLSNNYFVSITREIYNPNNLRLMRLDPSRPWIYPFQIQGEVAQTTFDEGLARTWMRIYPTVGGSNDGDFRVYDEENTDDIIFFKRSENRVISEKSWSIPPYYVDLGADSALTTQQSGAIIGNRQATGTITVDLPNVITGKQIYTFTRTANYAFRIRPVGASDLIRGGGVGKYLELTVQGASITLFSARNDIWEILSVYGTYSFEA